jgi:hypothetical protein
LRLGLVLLAVLGAPACEGRNPARPAAADMTGTWNGTSTYPNSPFRFALAQNGATITGDYRDQLDSSLGVTGTVTGLTFRVVVDFGDAKLNFNGTVNGEDTAEGIMYTSALSNRPFPFAMTRGGP